MADIFSKKKRSQIMASVSGKETTPEISVRKFLFSHGFRYRKNVKNLPAKPDIVLTKHKIIILVHGCFWHGHPNCKKAILPTTNIDFWKHKIDSNISRDKENIRELRKLGWQVIVIWECKLKNKKNFERSMKQLLSKLKV